jgi:hypothetical protein
MNRERFRAQGSGCRVGSRSAFAATPNRARGDQNAEHRTRTNLEPGTLNPERTQRCLDE